jgi:hypothetical protein
VAANALMGHRALLDYVRRRVLADDDLTGLVAEVRQLTGRRSSYSPASSVTTPPASG